jgi:hypothetical protein
VVFAPAAGAAGTPRNRPVCGVLNGSGLPTRLFDPLTPTKESERDKVFDVALLGSRLLEATRSLRQARTQFGGERRLETIGGAARHPVRVMALLLGGPII